jgi:hypothetical protein
MPHIGWPQNLKMVNKNRNLKSINKKNGGKGGGGQLRP